MSILDGVKGVLGDVIGAAERLVDGIGSAKLPMAFAKFYPGGLAAFLDRLRETGHGAAVDSWLGAGEHRPVTPETVAACLPAAVAERMAADLGIPAARVGVVLAEFLPAAVAEQAEDGKLKPQPSFSTQIR